MKQIDYYIESNTRLLEEKMKEYEENECESDKLIIKDYITAYKYYIKGLEDAKKYILEEID